MTITGCAIRDCLTASYILSPLRVDDAVSHMAGRTSSWSADTRSSPGLTKVAKLTCATVSISKQPAVRCGPSLSAP